MRIKRFLVVGVAFIISVLTAVSAEATTIDFGGTEDGYFPDGGIGAFVPYSEDGFTLSPFDYSQVLFWGEQLHLMGGYDEAFSIVASDGGLFTFDSVDYRAFDAGIYAAMDIHGLLDGVQTESLFGITSDSTIYATQLGWDSGIDELVIHVHPNGGILRLDNFVFGEFDPPVPEPATMTLLGLGMAGLALRRKFGSA